MLFMLDSDAPQTPYYKTARVGGEGLNTYRLCIIEADGHKVWSRASDGDLGQVCEDANSKHSEQQTWKMHIAKDSI